MKYLYGLSTRLCWTSDFERADWKRFLVVEFQPIRTDCNHKFETLVKITPTWLFFKIFECSEFRKKIICLDLCGYPEYRLISRIVHLLDVCQRWQIFGFVCIHDFFPSWESIQLYPHLSPRLSTRNFSRKTKWWRHNICYNGFFSPIIWRWPKSIIFNRWCHFRVTWLSKSSPCSRQKWPDDPKMGHWIQNKSTCLI